MNSLLSISVAVILVVFALPLGADNDVPDDTPANEPVRVEKDIFHPPVRLAAADGVIDCGPSWGHAGPWVEDVDGDGVKDLIVGDFSGLFRVYRNLGTNKAPRYSKAVNLQAGGKDAQVPIY
jgi:hypothetical protein